MAGLGTRFTESGYTTPKPLLPIHGVPMYRVVLANLLTVQVSRVVIVAQKQWDLSGDVGVLSRALNLDIHLIEIDHVTEGPAETVKLAQDFLDPHQPVVTANSDQFVNAQLDEFYESLILGAYSGAVLLMEDVDPKWSYARLNSQGNVVEIREKEVISPFATVGIYGFESASTMFNAFRQMQDSSDRVNGEFYVGPAYNYMQHLSRPVTSTNLGPIATVMFGLGIPEDYEFFIGSEVSVRAAARAVPRGPYCED